MKKTITLAALTALTTPAFSALILSDEIGVTGGGVGQQYASSIEILAEVGQAVDNTYDGSITFEWTMTITTLEGNGANSFALFELIDSGRESIGVGNYWNGTQYSTFNENGFGGVTESGTALAANTPVTFLLEIDYNAGADDTAVLNGGGFTNLVLTGDYSFTDVFARAGNSANTASFTNGTITAVPEPSSTALLGLGGLSLILRRRK